MEYEERAKVSQFVSGILLGMVIGAGVALLSAPDSGSKTRRRISRKVTGVREQAGDRWEEMSEEVRDRFGKVVVGARKRIRRG